jgi:hypothetical protein
MGGSYQPQVERATIWIRDQPHAAPEPARERGVRGGCTCGSFAFSPCWSTPRTRARFALLQRSDHLNEVDHVRLDALDWHDIGRRSNVRMEGTNDLLQVLRRVAHGFTNVDNFAARGLLVT